MRLDRTKTQTQTEDNLEGRLLKEVIMLRGILNAISYLAPTIAARRLSGSTALRHQEDFFTIPQANHKVVYGSHSQSRYGGEQQLKLLNTHVEMHYGIKGEIDSSGKQQVLVFSANSIRNLEERVQDSINAIPKMELGTWKKPK